MNEKEFLESIAKDIQEIQRIRQEIIEVFTELQQARQPKPNTNRIAKHL